MKFVVKVKVKVQVEVNIKVKKNSSSSLEFFVIEMNLVFVVIYPNEF